MAARPIPFEIHPSSGVPIYRQLVEQVHALVAGGKLGSGHLLPSVRQVAASAEINPMTVSKAYSLLETQGIVERVRGQGMRVVAQSVPKNIEDRLQLVRQLLEPAIHRASLLGLSDEQLQTVVKDMLDQLAKETVS